MVNATYPTHGTGNYGHSHQFANAVSPIYANSGYLPSKDYWRLGSIFGAIFLIAFVLMDVPWATLLWSN
ncbi:MAG: anion permease [Verrucomicrobia bacterium]|nr:anion permease [Verrucomicrobiota bacterium]